MLKDILENKKCFKLVCGAGNEDIEEVKKLVYIYSLAGCNFFDVCAKSSIVDSAKEGLKLAGISKDRYLCVSIGIEGDPHITKASINQEKCINCKNCEQNCPREAISNNKVNQKRCIGCAKCVNSCPNNAIEIQTQVQNYSEILPELISKEIDCIEFHAISKNKEDVIKKWQEINSLFKGMLCISVDRSTSGDKELVELVKNMVNSREPYSTIIQADGVAMSGNDDEYGTTLQAVATAQMFQNANLKAYIMMSGGTNTKSIELAKMCKVEPHCLAVGSYARKIIKKYLQDENLLSNNKKIEEAVVIARKLVETINDKS